MNITERMKSALEEVYEEMALELLKTDLKVIEEIYKEGDFLHKDDKKHFKQRLKAFKIVLDYYTIPEHGYFV